MLFCFEGFNFASSLEDIPRSPLTTLVRNLSVDENFFAINSEVKVNSIISHPRLLSVA